MVADSLAAIVRKSYKPDDIEHTLATSVASLHEMTKNSSSGSTLSVAVIPEDEPRAHVAILGDSPVMIFDGNGGINMSPSHNSRDNPKELEEAIKRGAKPQRGYIGADGSRELLQITRALGDRELGSVLSREPDIYSADITEDSVVMVSSDGVLGSGQKDNQRAIAYLENLLTVEKIDAEELVRDASRRGSKDNATAIIWRAKKD